MSDAGSPNKPNIRWALPSARKEKGDGVGRRRGKEEQRLRCARQAAGWHVRAVNADRGPTPQQRLPDQGLGCSKLLHRADQNPSLGAGHQNNELSSKSDKFCQRRVKFGRTTTKSCQSTAGQIWPSSDKFRPNSGKLARARADWPPACERHILCLTCCQIKRMPSKTRRKGWS